MEDKWKVACLAIICLTILEIAAMLVGINGYLFGVIVAAIAALAGYKIKDLISK